MDDAKRFKNTVVLGTALAASFIGYGRRAYSACVPGPTGTYTCSGHFDSTVSFTRTNFLNILFAAGSSVNTTGTGGNGVYGRTDGGNGNLTISDQNHGVNITGAANGIAARVDSVGALFITTSGNVSGQGALGYGIYAINATFYGTGLTINAAGQVSGSRTGIYAATGGGSGAMSITASGNVSGATTYGIYARNKLKSGGLSINAASVSGGLEGIRALNSYGAMSITTSGNVITTSGPIPGASRRGIYAVNEAGTTDLTIAAAGVTGGTDGIFASNRGTGGLSITASGNVSGATGWGIYADNAGTGLTIAAAGVTGGTDGIFASNRGTGALSITSSGNVSGAAGRGIDADNAGTDLTIVAAGVSGSTDGIFAINHGPGALSITSSGNVSGAAGRGIYANNNSLAGTDLTIAAAGVSGSTDGIFAINRGTGALRITTSGNVSGAAGRGIYASNAGTGLTIDAAGVSGGTDGIAARNNGSGALSITTNGLTQGGTSGINAFSANAGITITNSSTGIIQNSTGLSTDLAITTSGQPTTITNNGIITGTVALDDGGNTFNNHGTWNTAGDTNDFGTGVNTLFNATGGVINVVNSGTPVITKFSGITVTNAGSITLRNGIAGDRLVVEENFIGQNGAVHLDTVLGADASLSDQLVIDGGAATGTTRLFISNAGGAGAQTTGDGIKVVDAINNGTTTSSAFSLGNYVAAGAYSYDLFYGGNASTGGDPNDQDWYLRSKHRVEVALHRALPLLAQQFGLKMLDTLDDRIGARVSGCPGSSTVGPWARVLGQAGGIDHGLHADDASTNGPSYDWTMGGVQLGMDIIRKTYQNDSSDIAGVDFGLGHTDATVRQSLNTNKAGDSSLNGLTYGIYWTHYAANGWYTDAVIQGAHYHQINANSVNEESRLSTAGRGVLASIETGWQLAPTYSGLSFTPEAQVIYQRISIDDDSDAFGIIRHDTVGMFYGRLGARIAKNWTMDKSTSNQPLVTWVRVNVWGSSNNQANTTFAGLSGENPVTFSSDLGSGWAQLSLGVAGPLKTNFGLFATVDGSVPISGFQGYMYSGRVGLKYIA